MNGLLNRDVDLAELDATIRRHWKHHLIAVTGHHGVGKTALMRHWAQRTGIRAFYFEVQPGNAEAQKSDFLLSWKRAGFTGLESEEPGSDNFWGNVFRQMTVSARNQPGIFIIDNFDFLLAADPYVAGKLQEPADHWFPDSQLILCLIGSNIRVMKQLADYQAPLYGRFDLILEVDPLPFSALRWLYPERSFTERLRIYGVAGGFPGYLHSLDGTNNTIENFPEWNLLEQGQGIVESLAAMDEYYVPILCSIVKGADTLRKLTKRQGGFGKSDLHQSLITLELGRWIDRQFIANVPPYRILESTRSRYMIAHPLLRFYLQFVEPNIERLRMDNGEFVKRVRYQMDQFFRRKIFPVLCREWVWAQVALGRLPFIPESVGGFWKKNDSLDLLAINWQQKWMMLGQCLWSKPAKIEKIVCDMIGLSKSIVNGDDWKTQVVIFFGPDMASTLSNHPNISIKIVLVDSLDEDLYKGRVALKEKRFRALTN